MGLLHMGCSGVVVAGQRNAVAAAVIHKICTVWLRVAVLQFRRQGHLAFEFFIRPAFFPRVVNTRDVNVFPLALTGRMVHQRDQRQAWVTLKWFEQINGVGRRQLAPHMQVVVCAQQVFLCAQVDRLDHRVPGTAAQTFRIGIAHTQCIKNSGNACCSHLCIVGHERWHFSPLHFGPRHQMALEVVGVHLDKTRHEVVALQVQAIGTPCAALIHRLNAPALHSQTTVHHFGGQHQTGIFENDGTHTPPLNWATSTRRVATAAPTCAS